MSYLSRNEALIEELIRLSVPSALKLDSTKRSDLKDSIILTLRHQKFAPTNQFDVNNRLDGLDEKFRIHCRDKLADAISERRSKLDKTKTRWAAEILHLLLELAERPLSSSKLDDLGFLKPLESRTSSCLRWSDIGCHNASLEEENIWENVNFANDSTDDDYELKEKIIKDDDDSSNQISINVAEDRSRLKILTGKTPDRTGLEKLRESQFWQKVPNIHGIRMETVRKSITELQAVREVLFMLGGYPTSLFRVNPQSLNTIEASNDYALKNVSNDTFSSLLKSFAAQGSVIMTLRLWVKRSQSNTLLQVFQLSILERLNRVDTMLSRIHQRFIAPICDLPVSLLGINQEIANLLQFLAYLAEISRNIEKEPYGHAFRYLEMLYDLTCTLQMAGDDEAYAYIGEIFFKCFRVYLRPIRAWIEKGELRKDDKNFFVFETTDDVELSLLWESKFKLRKTKDGILHVPKFLSLAAQRIFNTGKSIVVLKHLNQTHLLQSIKNENEPALDFEAVCNPVAYQLAPFVELFDSAFDAWVCSKHQYATSILKNTLFKSCGLHTSLNALSHIYFLADGNIGSTLTSTIFRNLDSLKTSWNDRFTLTEHAQSSFSSVPSVSTEYLRMFVSKKYRNYRDVKKCRKHVKAFGAIELKYQLSGPVQIVVTPRTMLSYQKIFIFLLQVRRSSDLLARRTVKENRLDSIHNCEEQELYCSLRIRLLWFTQTIYYYLTSLVLAPRFEKMKADLKAAEDVDMMIKVHLDYMKGCVEQCLLGSRLTLIYNTVLKGLDLGIKLEDAHTLNVMMRKDALDEQQSLMDSSIASLGLDKHHQYDWSADYRQKYVRNRKQDDFSSEDDSENMNLDLSILSLQQNDSNFEDSLYISQLRRMKSEFHRLVNFIARGLEGVSRASGGDEARLWDILGEMLGSGLKT